VDRLERIELALQKLRETDPDWDTKPAFPDPMSTSEDAVSADWANAVVGSVVRTLWADPTHVQLMKKRALRAQRLRSAEAVIDLRDRPQPERIGPRPEWAVAEGRLSPR